jgi:hypothetical protein
MSCPCVWLIGDADAPEFARAAAWLGGQADCRRFATGAQGAAAAQQARCQAAGIREPDLVVWWQRRPGEFLQADVDAISRSFPLALLAAMVGPWCEGEPRSGRPMAGVSRIYWHQWRARLTAVYAACHERRWQVPRTATDVDRVLASSAGLPLVHSGQVGIVAPRRVDFESLSQVLEAGGYRSEWILPGGPPPVAGLNALVVDAAYGVPAAVKEIALFHRHFGPMQAVVLSGFPRPNEAYQIASLPHTKILGKPFLASDLVSLLASVSEREKQPARGHTAA